MSDPILLWNGIALEANRVSHTNGKREQVGPARSSRALAIVHLAMYDAYAGVINQPANLPPYINSGTSPGASADAAVAAAAHATLSDLFPSQRSFFDSILAASDKNKAGLDFGKKVAQAILNDRQGDPSAGGDYAPSTGRGKHRPDPDNPGQGFDAPVYGAKSKGFAVKKRYELASPLFMNGNKVDPDYIKALQDVRGKGIQPELMGTLPGSIKARKVDETVAGIYWGYDGSAELGTPPRLYNQIIRRVAIHKNNSVEENARLFAFVNVAMADAAILAWDQKYIHNFWRPVVGIREHDISMGPGAVQANNVIDPDCDSSWLPLGAPNTNSSGKNFTPNFPAYPSGHATFGAAAFHMTRLFYGAGKGGANKGDREPDKLFKELDFVSDELNGVNKDNKGAVRPRHVRKFDDGLWEMIIENGRSRVLLGVHWVFDAFAVKGNGKPDLTRTVDNSNNIVGIGGVPLGLTIAESVFEEGNGKAPKKFNISPRT